MVNECPNIADGEKLPIGKTAKLLGMHRDTLRQHSDAGLIKFGMSRLNNRRCYLGSEIKRYWKATY